MRPSRLTALLAALLLAPTGASAQGLVARLPGLGPTSFSFTSTTVGRYRGQNFDTNLRDDNFGSLTERLDVSALATPWRLYLRVDGFVPFGHDTTCAPNEAALCYLNWDLRPGGTGRDRSGRGEGDNILDSVLPERLSLRYQRRGLTLEIGDFYQVFGRGVALSFRKVDPIGLDTTLRGGRFEYERGRMTLRAFGGYSNPQNLDPISLGTFDDPRDLLVGGAVAARVGPNEEVEVSGHVVRAMFERIDEGNRQDDVDVAGWRMEAASLFGGDLSLYLEANVLRRTQREGRASRDRSLPPSMERYGRAIFAAVQVTLGRFTLLAEWKDYTHYLIAPTESSNVTPRDVGRIYSTAPSLERDDQRVFTNANTRGARLRLDYNASGSPWIFSLNSVLYGWAETTDPVGNFVDPWDAEHGYVTTHSYFAVRRRSRPVLTPQAASAPGEGDGGRRPAAPAGGQAGGANITAAGIGGASATRVASGDFNLLATAGYRREFHAGTERTNGRFDPGFEAGDIKHESIQFDIDYAFPVGSNDSLEIRLDHRFERNFTFDRITGGSSLTDNERGIFATSRGGLMVSWSHGLPLVVSAMLRWDNTARAVGDRGFFDRALGSSEGALLPTLYPSAEVRWNFTISNFVRVFGGMTPGGRVCSGGVCRDVPLFQGAIAELVLRI